MNKKEIERTGLEVAVIGMAGRFPGAPGIDRFWENLREGMASISFFSAEELEEAGVDPGLLQDPHYVKAKGILEDIEYFDALFFDYTPTEAEMMNPQLRILLECSWEALENAGYDPESYDGLIGLYVGASSTFYWEGLAFLSGKSTALGGFTARSLTNKDFLSTAISYKLNLKGPSSIVQTACSTSLVAIHWASRAVLSGECHLALAGGVGIDLPQKIGYLYQEGMISSPDGSCRAFDAKAKGTVTGNGAGIVVLKRLKKALADRDNIYAVIKGSAINNDGKRKVGYTAPSASGQAEVIRTALGMAHVEPGSIDYIEAHGTGTSLGDPVEIEALTMVFNTPRKGICPIGAIKTNMGHLDTAAGIAGFIKTVLVLKHRLIPPNLHFDIPNPEIDFIDSPFYVNTRLSGWEDDHYPLRAGVSSFGIGGTNAHVVIEEWVGGHSPGEKSRGQGAREQQLILLSAKTPTALDKMKKNLAEYLRNNPALNIADAAYTLQVGRKAFSHRWMAVGAALDEICAVLTSPGGGETAAASPKRKNLDLNPENPGLALDREAVTRIGRLWLQGHQIDWEEFHSQEKCSRIPLPTYPFERQWYWIDTDNTEGVTPIKKSTTPDMTDWSYIPTWKRSNLASRKNNVFPTLTQRWLVFMNSLDLGALLVKQLKEKSPGVIVVEIGHEFCRVEENRYSINPKRSDHYETLVKELQKRNEIPDKIVHLWGITGEIVTAAGVESVKEVQYLGFLSLLYMIKALGKQNVSKEIHIAVLTNHVQEVIGGEPLGPGKSTVLGLMKSIPQEYPNLRCSAIDINLPGPGPAAATRLIRALLDEILTGSSEPVVAYRNLQRWVQIYEPLHLEEIDERNLPFRAQGIYLVTGGLGNIGMMFSHLLVHRGGVGTRLILTGRSPFPGNQQWNQWLDQQDASDPISQKIKRLQKLLEMGAQVLYIQADVASPDQMRKVITQAEETFGVINGVIHAAGFFERDTMRTLQELSDNDWRSLFQAKVYGTLVLEELFKDKNLDFCWMLSSISCVLGGLGFGAYASANLFMDVLVKRHNQLNPSGPGWLSLNWDGMDAEKSLAFFERIFSLEKVDQLVVSNGGKLHERIDKWIKLKPVREGAKSKTARPAGFHPRPDLSNAYVAPRNPCEKGIVDIWEKLLGYNGIGVHDDFLELGGDSLRSITMISRIRQELEVNIPISVFFTKPTIEALAGYISGTAEKNRYIPVELVEEKEVYPISAAQEGLYIIQQMDKESISYNMTYIMAVGNEVDKNKLEDSVRKLIKRHESLRTSLEKINDKLVQRIHPEVDFSIEYFTLEPGGEAAPAREVEKIIRQFVRPFDLAKAPLLRMGMIELLHPSPGGREHQYIWMVDMHHIISDGISLQITIDDFMGFYTGPELPALMLRYKDYSEWRNSEPTRQTLKKQEQYWLKEFTGEVPELILPYDYARPAVRSFAGDTLDFEFDDRETTRLKNLALKEDVTMFVLLLALYNVLLFKLSGQEDIIVGTGMAGRSSEDLYRIIGLFINTLPLRNCPARSKPFNLFLREVKEKTLKAYENQEYHFNDLVKKIVPKRTPSRNPLYDVVIVLQNVETATVNETGPGSTAPGLSMSLYHHSNKISKYDISLICTQAENRLAFMMEYCTKLFKRESAEQFVLYFKEITAQILEDDEIKLENIAVTHRLLTAKPGDDEDQLVVNL